MKFALYYDTNRQRIVTIRNPKIDHDIDVLFFLGYDGENEFLVCENYLEENCELLEVA